VKQGVGPWLFIVSYSLYIPYTGRSENGSQRPQLVCIHFTYLTRADSFYQWHVVYLQKYFSNFIVNYTTHNTVNQQRVGKFPILTVLHRCLKVYQVSIKLLSDLLLSFVEMLSRHCDIILRWTILMNLRFRWVFFWLSLFSNIFIHWLLQNNTIHYSQYYKTHTLYYNIYYIIVYYPNYPWYTSSH